MGSFLSPVFIWIFVHVFVLLIILSLLILLLLLLLYLPIMLEVDSRIPHAGLRWTGIGEAWIWYEDEWWLSFRIFFFTKKISLSGIKRNKKRNEKKPARRKKKKNRFLQFKKITAVIRTFRVKQWEAGIDTSDYVLNAQLYPLNFLPGLFPHVRINFNGENYFFILINNNAWRMVRAFLR